MLRLPKWNNSLLYKMEGKTHLLECNVLLFVSSQCLAYCVFDLNKQCDCLGFLVLKLFAVVAWYNQHPTPNLMG